MQHTVGNETEDSVKISPIACFLHGYLFVSENKQL